MFRHFFFIFFAIAVLTSCIPEKKLAKDFISMPEKINIQLFSPQEILKYNHTGELIKGFSKLSSAEQDSALYFTSRYIRYVDDSVYLERYVNSFIEELRKLGMVVYVDNTVDSFLQNKPQSYVLNMAQVQLDEYLLPHSDSIVFNDSIFFKSFRLNAVDASSWLELSKVNANSPKKTVLFSTMTVSDAFEGNFYLQPFSDNVIYKYNIDSLQVRDIYDLAAYTGRQQAGYLFDYFMNNYIAINMPTKPMGYLRYDRKSNSFYFTDDEKFEVLK